MENSWRDSEERNERDDLPTGERSKNASASRRRFLKLSGSALATAALLGAGATTASAKADVADQYEPAHRTNYAAGNRGPSDVRWVVMHTIEGSYESGISWFKNPASEVSSHFVIGNEPGQITQMVDVEDVAHTNGNGGYNATGVNIELEGTADVTDFDDTIYEQTAETVRWICDTYDIPKRHPTYNIGPCSAYGGQGGVIGHEQIPAPGNCDRVTGGKPDPGSTWDWDYFMDLVRNGEQSFSVQQAIVSAETVNVRATAEVKDNVRHTQSSGILGTVLDGPYENGGYTWWFVTWDNGVRGWSPQPKLDAAGANGDGGGKEPQFEFDQSVVSGDVVTVRSSAEVGDNVVHTQPAGTRGTIGEGFVRADGYLWWAVAWENGVGGWSPQAKLDPAGSEDPGPPEPAFEIGESITSTDVVTVRSSAEVSEDNVVHTQPADEAGTVTDGYVTEDQFRWWFVEWANGVEGWSPQSKLASTAGSSASPNDVGGVETYEGRLSGSGSTAVFDHDVGPDVTAARVTLDVPRGTDFDLYVTLDGRRPSRTDYDRRSASRNEVERVSVEESQGLDGRLGLLVRSYTGEGSFSLTVETDAVGSDGTGRGPIQPLGSN